MHRHPLEHVPLVRDALPSFAPELERLIAVESPELAAQVEGLRLVGRCRCGQSDCATFHVISSRLALPASDYCASGLDCLELESDGGLVVVDVERGRLRSIEVLGRSDVKEELDAVIPPCSAPRLM